MTQQIVVQYIPDIVRDEKINIAVVVVDSSQISRAFTSNWLRVEVFAGHDIQFLKELENEVWTKDEVLKLASNSTGSIKFVLRGWSILPLDIAFEDAKKRYL